MDVKTRISNLKFDDMTKDETIRVIRLLKSALLHQKNEKYHPFNVYTITQSEFTNNSLGIENPNFSINKQQISRIYEDGYLYDCNKYLNIQTVEEITGHYLLFNEMLDTLNDELSQELIKKYHYIFKHDVFIERVNGHPCGEYKKTDNNTKTEQFVKPAKVKKMMQELIDWYNNQPKDLLRIIRFLVEFDKIHPFYSGNGIIGRMLVFKECLKNDIFPVIFKDESPFSAINYHENMKSAKEQDNLLILQIGFGFAAKKYQQQYFELIQSSLSEYQTSQAASKSYAPAEKKDKN